MERTERGGCGTAPVAVTGYKWVRLLGLEKANDLKLPQEFPFIVSPDISSDGQCSECGCAYRPVTYLPGGTTVAHHFHQQSGGIYHKSPATPLALQRAGRQTGWVITVLPRGRVAGYTFEAAASLLVNNAQGLSCDGRAEAVDVGRTLYVFCKAEGTFRLGKCEGGPLHQGLVIGRGDFLEPICSLELHPRYAGEVKLAFGFDEDGALFFECVDPDPQAPAARDSRVAAGSSGVTAG